MDSNNYNPETYWTEVGKRIESRDSGKNIIAGDDEPYYRYKRKEFLKLLDGVDFKNKSVLEIGFGPGGNLNHIWQKEPSRLVGADISEQMVKLARNKVAEQVELVKINGVELPFKNQEFDIVFTATVLQHNTDEKMLSALLHEISRVSKDKVFLFERIENEIKGDELCLGRPVDYYSQIVTKSGFALTSTKFINIRVSYFICGIIRIVFNKRDRKEGEPLNKFSTILQQILLPITSILDKIFRSKKDIGRLEYTRRK